MSCFPEIQEVTLPADRSVFARLFFDLTVDTIFSINICFILYFPLLSKTLPVFFYPFFTPPCFRITFKGKKWRTPPPSRKGPQTLQGGALPPPRHIAPNVSVSSAHCLFTQPFYSISRPPCLPMMRLKLSGKNRDPYPGPDHPPCLPVALGTPG